MSRLAEIRAGYSLLVSPAQKKFKELISAWPSDLISHTMNLTEAAFASDSK